MHPRKIQREWIEVSRKVSLKGVTPKIIALEVLKHDQRIRRFRRVG